jgi:hypothetical protein
MPFGHCSTAALGGNKNPMTEFFNDLNKKSDEDINQ